LGIISSENSSNLGGIDAQGILPNATPLQVKEEVSQVRKILGPNIIISSSHEAILPVVPPENGLALAGEAHQPS
jgi:hypothetical protein